MNCFLEHFAGAKDGDIVHEGKGDAVGGASIDFPSLTPKRHFCPILPRKRAQKNENVVNTKTEKSVQNVDENEVNKLYMLSCSSKSLPIVRDSPTITSLRHTERVVR